MGKHNDDDDDEFTLNSIAVAQAASLVEINDNDSLRSELCCCNCNCCYCWLKFSRIVNLKCVFAILFGISVFISALFWLPPFFNNPGDHGLDSRFRGHAIVASFKLQKPMSFVKDNVMQLEVDIYNELLSANAKVVIISLESFGLNSTNILFGIDSSSKRSKISPTALSLIRSYFGLFVTQDMELLLTKSLFGEPSFFEVLKFPGGITITPHQHVYPLQKVQISFNFTLNNSILQIQDNFGALVGQLKSGLHLTSQEILYISLTNSRGSTIAPPAIVQTSVVLTVGVPSVPRMKQLAKTIKDSPTRNLGLNNNVFGKVKQVSLSSILPSIGASSPTPGPSPCLTPHFYHRHHHHHHLGHHVMSPSESPTIAPRPVKGSPAPMRSYRRNPHGATTPVKSYHVSPPGKSPGHSRTPTAYAPSVSHQHPNPALPHQLAKPPSPVVHQISPSSPLPNVIYARAHPPASRTEVAPKSPDKTPVAPVTSSGGRVMATHWILSVLVALLLHPWLNVCGNQLLCHSTKRIAVGS